MPIAHTDIQIAEITLRQNYVDPTLGTKTCHNVFHYRRTNFPAAPSKAELAAAFDTNFVQVLLLAQCDEMQATTVGVRWWNDPDDPEAIFAATPLTAGQLAADPLPQQDTVTMLLRTALRGKSYRGSKRFAGASDAHATSGYLAAAGLTVWDAARDTMTNTITDATAGNIWKMCVLSRLHSSSATVPWVGDPHDVTSVLINRNIGSQDTRRVKTSVYV